MQIAPDGGPLAKRLLPLISLPQNLQKWEEDSNQSFAELGCNTPYAACGSGPGQTLVASLQECQEWDLVRPLPRRGWSWNEGLPCCGGGGGGVFVQGSKERTV